MIYMHISNIQNLIQILISRLIKFCDESYVAPDCTLYGIRFDAIWYQIVSAVSHQIANFFILGQVTLIRHESTRYGFFFSNLHN